MSELQSIELFTREAAEINLQRFPLTTGIPFAKGALGPDTPVAICDETGQALPLQTSVMETHDDGSVRWMLLDFQADLPSLEVSKHTLKLGQKSPEPPASQRIEAKEDGDSLIVDNGLLKIELQRSKCTPLRQVWYNGQAISGDESSGGIKFAITDAQGNKYTAANETDVQFEIEEPGPMRMLVRWEGTHRDKQGKGLFDFLVRLTVYAGQPFVRIDHVFTNRLDPEFTDIESIQARLPINAGDKAVYQISDNNISEGRDYFDAKEPLRLMQDELRHFQICDSSSKVLRDVAPLRAGWRYAKGWVDVSGAERGVMVAAKNFWQNFPKAIAADNDSITYELLPKMDKPYDIPRGLAKTHTFFVQFHEGQRESQSRMVMANQLQRWPMPAAPAEYYLQSGQIWDNFAFRPKKYPRIENALRNMFFTDNAHFAYQSSGQSKAFGWKHYGDWWGHQGVDAPTTATEADDPQTYYMNNEYDTSHVYTMLFLHQHETVMWWEAEAHALHAMDIDTIHHTVYMDHIPDMRHMQGAQWAHCKQHIHTSKSGYKKPMMALGSHTFAEGIVDYYHLTGDRRARDIALATGLALGLQFQLHRWGLSRNTGWGLLAAGAAYQVKPHKEIAKGAAYLLEACCKDAGISLEDAGNAFEGIFLRDRFVNLAMRGLIRWHQATGDPKFEKGIRRIMEGYVAHGFFEDGLPLQDTEPEGRYAGVSAQGFANLESLAYAYRLTGDKRYVEAGIGNLCRAVEWMHSPELRSSKFIEAHRPLRGIFPFLAIADELGLLERVPGGNGWLLPTGELDASAS